MPNPTAAIRIAKGVGLIIVGVAAVYMVWRLMDYLEAAMSEGFEGRAATVTYYYMDGCPHCRAMKPEWEKFKELAKKSSGAVVAKEVSAEKEEDEVAKADPKVSGFPTIHISVAGKAREYSGKRDAASIMAAAQAAK